MKLQAIYQVTPYGIISATPIKATEKFVYFKSYPEATYYRNRISKKQYENMPKSPLEAIQEQRATLYSNMESIKAKLQYLDRLEREEINE